MGEQGRLIVTKGKPELDEKTGMYEYKDTDGKKSQVSKGDIVQTTHPAVLAVTGNPVGLHLHETRGTGLLNLYAGLQAGLAGMLVSPSFLFVVESTEPDPAAPGKQRLDAYSKATRLSFFLWGTTPDDALLAAADCGAGDTGQATNT